MVDIRMPDGTLIQGVPDGVSKSDLEQKLISNYGRSRFYQMIGREEAVDEPWMNPTEHDEYIKSASSKYNIPEARLRRQIWQESKFDPQATSEAGAQGLMQVMPTTQKELGINDPYDPAESIDKGAAYMRKMLDRFEGDYDKALAAYHSGASRVQDLIDERGENWMSGLGPVGRKYVHTQRQDFAYSAAAQTKPEDEAEEIPEPAAPAQLTEKQMRDRAVLSDAVLSAPPMMGTGGGTDEEKLAEQGGLIRRMVNLGIYDPSAYYMTQDEIDQITRDQVQDYALGKQERTDQAAIEDRAMDPEEENADRGWWKFTKAVFGNKGTQIFTGFSLSSKDTDIIRQQDIQIGQLYLERLNSQYNDAGDVGQEIVDEAAAKHGMTPEEFAIYTANQVDLISKEAIGDVKLIQSVQEEIEAARPEGGWATKIASMVIENTPQLAYIGAGIATGNPVVTMSLMGSEVYATTYANARAAGRDASGAAQDAFAAAAIEIGTEGIAVDKFIKMLKAGNRSKARRMFEGILTEGAQEVLAEAGQIAYDVGILEEDMTWGEAFGRMRDAGVVGMVIGGGISVPMMASMNNDLANAQDKFATAKKDLQSVVTRMQDPNQRITKEEIDKARQAVVDAHSGVLKIQTQIEQEALDKKAKKLEKKEAKRVKKMSPLERKRYDARKEAATAAAEGKLALDRAPTDQELALADLIERAGERDVSEKDADNVQTLLDKGFAKINARGDVMILNSGKAYLQEIRNAQKKQAKQADEVIEPIPFKRKEHVTPPPEGRDVPIKVRPFKSQQKRRAELVARVTAAVTDEDARTKIADAILRAEQEDAAYAQKEAEDAKKQAKLDAQKLDKDYDLAIKQVRAEEAEVAEGLIAMDEKRISGYQGTRLGDVLRNAMNVLEKAEAKAKEQLKDALWNKPTQGELFDVTGVLVRGTRDYANLVKVGALKLAKIGLKYGAWTADMVGEYGDSVRPALAQIYADAKKKVRDVMRISHEKFKTGERAGELKYAPTQYAKPGQIRKLRRTLEKLAKEGERGRMWYERTGKEILNITGGNMEEARKLAGLLAIYSSGTAVGANLTNALKMWADFKGNSLRMPKTGTKAGRFTEQDQTAIAWLKSDQSDENFVESFGPKRFPFFTNIMREIDPAVYESGQGATVDLWMMRALGYDTVSPTDPQNAFAATEIANIADKMGWEKQQAQAAIWVAIKARWEYIQTVAKNRAVKEGLAEWVPGKKGKPTFEVVGASREEQIANEKAIIGIFRDEALSVSLAEVNEKLDQSAQDFADYMGRHYGVISWEAEPSSKLGLAFNKMPLEAKIMMQAEIAQALTNPETGRELLAEWLGLLGQNQFIGPGAWEMNIGSATQNSVILPQKHKMDGPEVNEKAAQAMDGYSAIMGMLLLQDSVAWHRPFYAVSQKASNGVEVIATTLSHGEAKLLYDEIVAAAVKAGIPKETASDWAPIILDGAFRVLNFSTVDNKTFHKIIQKAADNAGIDGHMELFASVGNLISNDWVAHPNGEQYEHQISKSKNSKVQKAAARAVSELGPKIEAIRKKYAAKYSAYPSQAARVTPASQATKKPKKGFIRFRHFSTAQPKKLRVKYSGTGIKGAERARSPSTQIDVISAYPDKGFTKEVGLGPYEYVIDVREEDMYNLSEDPLNLYGYGKEPQTFNADMKPIGFRVEHHKVEKAIRDAGYLGYYVPKSSGNMKGQARFFVDLDINRGAPEALDATFAMADHQIVDIHENEYDEFEVRELNGEIYYASDLDDAIGTARQIWGEDVDVDIYDSDGTLVDTDVAEAKPVRIKLRNVTKAEVEQAHGDFLDEVEESTTLNPLAPDQRVVNNEAVVELRPMGDVMWLDWINAFNPGSGAGARTLDWLVDLANRHGVTLKLFSHSMNEDSVSGREGGLNQAQLDAFYKSRGFSREEGRTFVRLPQGPNTATFMSFENIPNTTEQIGFTKEIADAEVDSIAKELELPREIFRVVQSVEGLPNDLQEKIAIWGASDSVHGVYRYEIGTGPVIYIVAGNIYDRTDLRAKRSDLIQTIIHETLGHFGLQSMLTPKEYAEFMDLIRKHYPKEVARRGRDMSKSVEGRRLAAEEVFAYMAQDILENKAYRKSERSLIDKIIDAIRLKLAKLGWRKLDDGDLIAMMQRVTEFTKKKNANVLRKRAALQEKMRRYRMKIEQLNGEWTGPAGASHIEANLSIGLEKERKADPELDRFMTKIGHGHVGSFVNLREWWDRTRLTWRETTEREIFDQFASIKRREQELGIFGEQSGYMSVRLSAGVDVMIRAAIEHGVPVWRDGWAAINENEMSLLDVLAPVSQSAEMLKAFEAWLVANRSRRLSKEQREKLLSRKEIASAIRFIRKKKLYHLFKQTANDLAAYKKSVLDFAEEAGIINSETRPLWENSDHVPFYRVLTKNDKVGPFASSRIGHIKNPIRRLTGGTAPLKPPLDSIVQNLSMLMEAAVKNKAMTDVVKNFNGSGVITKAPQAELSSALIPLEQIQDRLDEAGVSIDAVGRDMLKGIQKLTSLQAPTDENVVSILENGKKQYYYVHDTGIMRGLEGVTPSQWTALMRVLRAPKRWLTWSITRMPDFILKNWYRDVWHAYVLGRHGTIAPGYDSVRGWAKAIREDETFRDMMAGGGVFHAGYVNAVDPKGTHTAIRAMVLGKGRHGILDTPRKLWEFYTRIADGAENAHRVAVYEKALKKTGSRKVALFESRDLMDFSVRGRHGIIRFLAETVPFWSARVQGIQRTGKGFTENPKLTVARALPITIATIMLYAMNKDDDRYKALNPYDKRMYYHFFDVFNAGDHWRLPKPFEIGALFSTIPEIITEFTLSEQPDRGDALLQSIVWTAGEMLSLYPEVQVVMPFYELMTNKNSFTQAPILNMRDENLPPEGQYSDRTNVTIRAIAEAMPDFMPDFMRSPKQLEHLTRGYFGSLVDYVTAASDELAYLANPDLPPRAARRLDETPFVKSFARENQEKYDVYLTSLYDVLDEADKVYYRVKQLRDEGDREGSRELAREEEALLFAKTRMEPAEKRIKKINEQIHRVMGDEKMTPTQKRDKLDKLYKRRSDAAKRVYDYRPGGTRSKGAEPVKSVWDTVVEKLQGKPKKEQVDELISQNLPRTAVLVNDMQISDEKLRDFA